MPSVISETELLVILNALSPIKLHPIPYGKNAYINKAIWIIQRMLKIDKASRISVQEALLKFNKVFDDYAKEKEKLDGSAI